MRAAAQVFATTHWLLHAYILAYQSAAAYLDYRRRPHGRQYYRQRQQTGHGLRRQHNAITYFPFVSHF